LKKGNVVSSCGCTDRILHFAARANSSSGHSAEPATATALSRPVFAPIASTSNLDVLTAATAYPNQLAPIQSPLYPTLGGPAPPTGPIPAFHPLATSSPNTHHNLTNPHSATTQLASQSPSGMSPADGGAPSPAAPAPGGFSLRKLLSTRPEIEPGKARSHSIAAVFATDPEPEAGVIEFENSVQAGVIPESHVASLFEL
jgi:hypothetical protein